MTSDLPTGWSLWSLSDLVEIFDGPHATPRKTAEGPIFLGIANLNNGRLDLTDVEHLSEEDFVRWTKRVTPTVGDIVFSYETRLGEAAYIADELRFCLGRRMGLLRVKSDVVLPRFLLYAYLGPQFQNVIRERTIHGSTVDRIPLNAMAAFPILLPELHEQERVLAILGALDGKIDSNRKLASLLEQTVAALFRARFVDFVGTDEFEESEIGPIPRGWTTSALASLARFVNGKAFTKDATGQGRPILRIKELNAGIQSDTLRTNMNVAEEHLARHQDILFAWSGSLAVYRWSGPESVINQHIFKVIPDGYPSWFVYQWVRQHMPEFQAIARDKATTMGHIQRRHLSEALVALPDPDTLARVGELLEPLDQWQGILASEVESLATIRDSLLPELISGEIRVPDTSDSEEAIGLAVEQLAGASA